MQHSRLCAHQVFTVLDLATWNQVVHAKKAMSVLVVLSHQRHQMGSLEIYVPRVTSVTKVALVLLHVHWELMDHLSEQ